MPQTINQWLERQDEDVIKFAQHLSKSKLDGENFILDRIRSFVTRDMRDLKGYGKYVYVRTARVYNCDDDKDGTGGRCVTINVHRNYSDSGGDDYVRLNNKEFSDLAEIMGYVRKE